MIVNILEGERDAARAELAALRAVVPLSQRDFPELAFEAAVRMLRGRDVDARHAWQTIVGAFGEQFASVGLHEALIACDERIPTPSAWLAKHLAAGQRRVVVSRPLPRAPGGSFVGPKQRRIAEAVAEYLRAMTGHPA